ncbi:MAG: hypothetical protein COA78_27620 [Blastopirellula sp.]|nr:MAG: hypothetical protein COA78_27620 [Blastopirellula sp.]
MLSTEEKQRVIAALEFDPNKGDIISLVERLETSAELHQFVLNYNSNDGLLPLWTIAKNPVCDQGTALCIYWLLGDFAMNREAYHEKIDPNWNGVGLIEEIEQRYTDGFYTEQKVCFVPTDYLDWSPTKVKLVKHQSGGILPFPEIMLERSPGEDIPQEWM